MTIKEYHAHVYYTDETKESIGRLYARLQREGPSGMFLGRLHQGPVGPHCLPMFTVVMEEKAFTATVSWLMLHHGPHSVLIHPDTGNDRMDHTQHALWLGPPQPLDLASFS